MKLVVINCVHYRVGRDGHAACAIGTSGALPPKHPSLGVCKLCKACAAIHPQLPCVLAEDVADEQRDPGARGHFGLL